MRYLNVGCGAVFHSSWTNIDMVSYFPEVKACDLRKGIPYPDEYFDACYSSHVLEHLTAKEATTFLKECLRVLKVGGVLRIVVPDLESICRQYLCTLERASKDEKAEADHHWMVLELLDQTVRYSSGGKMKDYLSDPNISNKDFVSSRLGCIAEECWFLNKPDQNSSLWKKLKSRKASYVASSIVKKIRINLAKIIVLSIAGNDAHQAFEEGLFRHSGEIHRWMYDSLSLRQMLKRSGFVDVQKSQPDESRIPMFNDYGLDIVAGKVRIPQSLFIEGVKP